MRKLATFFAAMLAAANVTQASVWVNGVNQERDSIVVVIPDLAAISNSLYTTILSLDAVSNLVDSTALSLNSVSNVADGAAIDIQMLHLTNSGTFGGVPVQTRWYNDGGTNIYQVLNNSIVGFEVRF